MAEMVDLQSMYEGIQALRQAIDKRWDDQKQEVNAKLVEEIKRVSAEMDTKFAEMKTSIETAETERRMKFSGDDTVCKYGEPPLMRKYINNFKKEYMEAKGGRPEEFAFSDFLSVIQTGYPGYPGGKHHPLAGEAPPVDLGY